MRGLHEHPHPHHRGRGGPWGDAWMREWGGPRRGGGGPRRMRRGDIRPLLLTALLDGPAHGYEIIHRLEERSSGVWRPSPGSVYPTLQLLADEGAVTATDVDAKRVYELTEAGRTEAEARKDEPTPWSGEAAQGERALAQAGRQLMGAFAQVLRAGNADQIERATAAIRQARQTLYQILSED